MQHPEHLEEGTIHAWLDGALSPAERDVVARHIAECGECADQVAEARGVIAGASRIVSSLDVVPGNVVPVNRAAVPRPLWRRLHLTPARAALAASVLLAVSAMLAVRHEPRDMRKRTDIASEAAMPAVAASTPAPSPPLLAPAHRAMRTQPIAKTDPTTVALAAPPAAANTEAKPAEVAVARADSAVVDSVPVRAYDAAARRAPAPTVAGAMPRSMATTVNQLRAMPFTDASRNDCYRLELDTSSALKNLPERFALQRDQAGRNVVRAVTPDGRVDSALVGSNWQARPPELVVRFATPRPTVLTFTSTSLRAQASSGDEHRSVVVHRADCRP